MFLFAGVSFAWMLLGFFMFEEDEPSAEEDKRVDWIGVALITVGLVLIVFVLSDLPTAPNGWKTPCESTSPIFSKFILTRLHEKISSLHSPLASFSSFSSSLGSTTWSAGSRSSIFRLPAGLRRRS